MRQTKWPVHRCTVAVVALVVGASFGVLRTRDASSEPMAADGAPSGMVTFVGGGVCPPGWVHASHLEGRTIVGTVAREDVGILVGTPFAEGEERLHHHDYTATVNLPMKSITAANNGLDPTVAAPGAYSLEGSTTDDAARLPFFQMEGCIKP